MDTHNNSDNSKTARAKRTITRDPRDRVTPDAFQVSDKVLGKPLATPKRRGLAMFIDLLIIQQLSQMGSMLLGFSLAGMLFLLSLQKKSQSVGRGFKEYAKYLGIVMLIGLISYEMYLIQTDQGLGIVRQPAESISLDNSIDDSLPLQQQLDIAKQRLSDYQQQDKDLIDLIEQIAEQFGYGFGWAAVYFTLFVYLSNGQTLGKWLCRIQIIQLDGKRIGMWAALGRYGGYAASFVTGLSGFFQIYWDANRQGLHDKVSSTVVICLNRSRLMDYPSTTHERE